MARRKIDKPMNWAVWDKPDPKFVHKQKNEELLNSGDPTWSSFLSMQSEETQEKILSGLVSLEEVVPERPRRDEAFPNQVRPFDQEATERELTPEEAQVNMEAEPIASRFEALRSQFSGSRDVMGANADFENLDTLRALETPEARKRARDELTAKLGKTPGPRGEAADAGIMSRLAVIDEAERIFTTPGEFDKILQRIGSERILGAQEAGRAEEYYDRTGNIGTRTVGDVASNLESGLSIVGGLVGGAVGNAPGALAGAAAGSAPMAKIAYDASYTEARLAGADQAQARTFATAMAGSEFILEAVGGKVASKVGLGDLLKGELKKFLPELAGKKSVKAAGAGGAGLVTGYLEEAGTSAIQDLGALAGANLTDDPQFKTFLTNQISRSKDGSIDMSQVLEDWNRAGMAGAAQAGPVVGAAKFMEDSVNESRNVQQAVLNNTVGNEAAKARYSAIIDAANKKAAELSQAAEKGPEGDALGDALKANTDLFGAPAPAPATPDYLRTSPTGQISDQYRNAGGNLSDAPVELKPLPLTDRATKIREKEAARVEKDKAKAEAATVATARANERAKKTDTDKFMTEYLRNNPDATDSQVALAGQQFESTWAPPKATTAPQTTSKPVTATTAPPVATETKPAPSAIKEDVEPSAKEIEQEDVLKKIEGLSSERKPEKVSGMAQPKGRVRKVIQNLARTGTADSEGALDLINKGKLGIVETEAELPDGLTRGRDGWYDPTSKRVWLVAENLDPKTLRGTALHEINHFLNRNKKDAGTKTGLRKLISGNLDDYNTRIKNLAKTGNKIAKTALERAEASGNVTEELTSYFASESLDAISKKGVLGTAGQVFKDIKSAINTTARDKGIATLTDNDISYILRRQIEDAPDVEFTDGADGLEGESMDSIIGERAAGFNDQVGRTPERLYRGELDNRNRIEISDRGAKLSPNYKERLKKPTFLGAIIDHKNLFDNYSTQMVVEQDRFDSNGRPFKAKARYGSMKSIQVAVSDKIPDGMSYDSVNDKIVIAESALKMPEEKLKSYLLHEMQHAIQARENFAGGANYHRFLEQERQVLKNKLGTTKLPEQAELIAHQRAWTKYDRTYGEAEARLSERNFNLTEDELSEQLPEDRFTEKYMLSDTEHVTQRLPAERTIAGTSRPVSRVPSNKVTLPEGLASIKAERGGNFDNQFVDKFAYALGDADYYSEDHPEGLIRLKASERMLKNYLSKWAGNPNDPLKDFTHPMFEDYDGSTLTWEQLWDDALVPASARSVRRDVRAETTDPADWRLPDPRIPDDAIIWGGMTQGIGQESARLRTYLRHVRDYLDTVPAEELGKYDLVRAVRETQQWDEEAKKKAEKARAVADKNLETYIEFPDGSKWVRLNKPGQFAAESDIMGHSVRGYEPSKEQPLSPRSWLSTLSLDESSALRNTFNDFVDRAWKKGKVTTAYESWLYTSPQYKAYLEEVEERSNTPEVQAAGEGGSANYGYGGWDAIKDDTARIYSLRDKNGKSMVTVELGKDKYADGMHKALRSNNTKFEVSQIKGRFNASPDPSTFPKTQDLILNLNEEGILDRASILDARNAGLIFDDIFSDSEQAYYPITSIYGGMLNEYRDSALGGRTRELLEEKLNSREASTYPGLWDMRPSVKRKPSGGLASTRKGFSDKSTDAWDSATGSLLRTIFDPNKGITAKGLETLDYWRLKSGGIRDLAEGHTVRINDALKVGNYNKKAFELAVHRAEDQKTPVERERAFDALVRNYGQAGREYREGRALIDGMSKDILKSWYEDIKKTGRKASAEELRVMNSIVENIGKYATRVYLANIPQIGETYAKALMKKYDKGDENDPYFKRVKDAVDYLIDHEVAIPNEEVLQRRHLDTVRRTYQTWIGPGANLQKQEMIDALMAKNKDITPEQVDNMARKTVREMLGLDNPQSTNPVAMYYRGASVDQGIVSEREKIPEAIRTMLGEVTDPGQRILVTASAQADLLFKQRMLNDFYDNFEGNLWVRPADRAKPGNEKFSEKLSGESYGPLNGMYVTKPFANAIQAARVQLIDLKDAFAMSGMDQTMVAQAVGGKIAKGIGTLSTVQKMTKTALDHGAWALNAAGSPIALLKNGQILGSTEASRNALREALTLALQSAGLEHKKNEAVAKRLSVLLEHGIPDSVFTAELRDSEKEFYQKLLTDLDKGVLNTPKKIWGGIRKVFRAARDTYGLLDSWVKIADFYGQQEYLTDYYKANGETVSQEQINREAADIVKFRNITYSRTPLAVQILERSGATVFATFAAEVLRTMVTTPYTVKMAVDKARDAKTPEARNIALAEATRVGTGYMTAVAMLPSITHMVINQAFNGEDDDEKAKEERERFLKLTFESDRDQSYYVIGKNASGGTVMFNASRADPHGHVTDFVRQAAQSDDPEEYWAAVKDLFVSPVGNGYIDDVISLATDNGPKNSNLAETLPLVQRELQDGFENVGAPRDQADRLTRVLDNFVPGVVRPLNAEAAKTVKGNDSRDVAIGNLMAASGMRMTVIDPKKIAGLEATKFNNTRARAVTDFNSLMNRGNVEREDIVRTALNIYSDEQAASRRLAEVYSGLDTEIAGVNPRKTLEDSRVNPEDVNDAALGRYRSVVLSPARLRELEKKQLDAAKTPDQRAVIRKNFDLARDTLRELNLETR